LLWKKVKRKKRLKGKRTRPEQRQRGSKKRKETANETQSGGKPFNSDCKKGGQEKVGRKKAERKLRRIGREKKRLDAVFFWQQGKKRKRRKPRKKKRRKGQV